jgi:hypothetical protein
LASYQREYPQIDKDINKAVQGWLGCDTRQKMVNDWRYFTGDNVTISTIERYYWSEPKKQIVDGKEVKVGGGLTKNHYVSNNRIGYGFYTDMVSQKVNTLLDELPKIESDYQLDNKFIKNLGYALKLAGTRAAAQGVGYFYFGLNNKFTVFKSEDCIPYYDDETGILRAFIRFWTVAGKNGADIKYIETYTEQGLTTYCTHPEFRIIKPTTPYKFRKITDFSGDTIEPLINKIPIFVLRNNEEYRSDMTPNIRNKIDVIDTVNSGFANNIDDFSELYWVVKNGAGMNSAEFEDFIANINRTKKVILTGDNANSIGVDTHQINIPTEARTKFVEERKKELIQEAGVIDTDALTSKELNTVTIKAATLKLRQRVSDFEWEVYPVATAVIELYQEYNNVQFDFDISFTKLLIQNDTEILQNANSVKDSISRNSYLKLVARAGYIDNVEDEEKRLEEESLDKYDRYIEEGLDAGTQGYGQIISEPGEENNTNI